MNLDEGYIILPRSILGSVMFQNPNWIKVYLWCFAKAGHTGRNVSVQIGSSFSSVWLKRGQFLYGRNKAAEMLGMKPSTVRNIMAKLEGDFKVINCLVDNHYTIVEVRHYDLYEDIKNYFGQPMDNGGTTGGQRGDNRWTTDGQSEDTNKTLTILTELDTKEKNIEKEKPSKKGAGKKTRKKPLTDPPDFEKFIIEIPECTKVLCRELQIGQNRFRTICKTCFDHFSGKGKKMADWDAVVRNWIRKGQEFSKTNKPIKPETNNSNKPETNNLDQETLNSFKHDEDSFYIPER